MYTDETKYERIVNTLKKSKPVLRSPDDIEEKVINRILQSKVKNKPASGFLDFLFGWVYVGWVRTGLVAASILLIVAFAYQQVVILKRVNNLNQQAIFIESQMITGSQDYSYTDLLYRLAGRKLPSGNNTVSEKQMKQILKSYNELQEKYKDLIKLIEENPELKVYVEQKLTESNKKKIKL
jgi:hypothetical protein